MIIKILPYDEDTTCIITGASMEYLYVKFRRLMYSSFDRIKISAVETEYSRRNGQCRGWWCPGSLHHHIMSIDSID